jgi:DNA-binding PadR family transcriptional regulator
MFKTKQVVTWSDEIDVGKAWFIESNTVLAKWLSKAEKARFIESEAEKAFLTKTKKIWLARKTEIINGIKAWNESNDPLTETDKVWLAEIKESIYTKEEAIWSANKAWIDEAEKAWLMAESKQN